MKIQADVYLTACGLPPMPKKWELAGWKADCVTDKQKNMLEEYGIAYARVRYKGQASMIISTIIKRDKAKMATPQQIQVLLKNGYAIGRIKLLTKTGASRIINKYDHKPERKEVKKAKISGYLYFD